MVKNFENFNPQPERPRERNDEERWVKLVRLEFSMALVGYWQHRMQVNPQGASRKWDAFRHDLKAMNDAEVGLDFDQARPIARAVHDMDHGIRRILDPRSTYHRTYGADDPTSWTPLHEERQRLWSETGDPESYFRDFDWYEDLFPRTLRRVEETIQAQNVTALHEALVAMDNDFPRRVGIVSATGRAIDQAWRRRFPRQEPPADVISTFENLADAHIRWRGELYMTNSPSYVPNWEVLQTVLAASQGLAQRALTIRQEFEKKKARSKRSTHSSR